MRKGYQLFFLLIINLVYSCSNPISVRKVPLEDFFKNPVRSNLQISPNGNCIAFLQDYKGVMNLFVQQIDDSSITRLTSFNQSNIRNYYWGNNDKLLFLRDQQGDESYHLFSIDKNNAEDVFDLTPFENIKIRLVNQEPVNNNEILITLNKRDKSIFDLYRLNITNGVLTMITQNPGNISTWMADHNGKVRLAIATDGVNESILFRDDEDSQFAKSITLNFKETLSPICFTADNKSIYAISNLNRDKSSLVEFNLETATETKIIFSHPEVDIQEMNYSNISKEPYFCNYVNAKFESVYFTKQAKELQNRISQKLKGKNFLIVNYSENEDRFIIRTYSDKSLGVYYLYEYTFDKLIKISDISPWLMEDEMASMKPFSFTSRDGLLIHGYLTLPKNSKGKKMPLIVNPHGGPFIRNRWTFNPETQFLANRGYAVLQVNYRGSSGYGKKFLQAGYKEIGRKMQYDITDAVKYLIKQGLVDSTRMGIYGFSFGGYFALNGVISDSNLYKCAASYCGLTNLFSFIKEIPPQYKQFLSMTYEMCGNPEEDADYLNEYSPIFHVDKIKVPILIIHGKKDARVSEMDVSAFVKQLQKQQIPVRYILKENEGHGFQIEENKFELYKELEQFFHENLKKNE